jgi:hypothetical protein
LAEFDLGQGPQLIVGGSIMQSSTGTTVRGVARWTGAAWAPLGEGFGEPVRALKVFDDGSGPRLFAAGDFQSSGSTPTSHIAVWNGSAWSGIGDLAGGSAFALEVFDGGTGPALYVSGAFKQAGGIPAASVARYDGTSWSALGSGISGNVLSLRSWNSPSGPRLVAGGEFSTAGGLSANLIAAFDGTNWSALGAGFGPTFWGQIRCLTTLDVGAGSELYAAGSFSEVGGLPGSHLARWNGASWTEMGSAIARDEFAPSLTAIESVNWNGSPLLAISGLFESAGGVVGPNIASYDASGFHGLGVPNAGILGEVLCSLEFDDGSGPALFVGGNFGIAGGSNANGIARFDGTSFHALGTGTALSVEALAIYDDGFGPKLYAGGNFESIGGITTPGRVARWNGSAWEALPGGTEPTGGFGIVWALAVFDDGGGPALYAGMRGLTNQYPRLARWRGGVWTQIFLPLNGDVFALATYDLGAGPRLVLGGRFNALAGSPMNGVAAFDGTNVLPISFGFIGVGGDRAFVEALHVHDGGSGAKLYAAGSIASADLAPAWGIARLDGGAWQALPDVGLAPSTGAGIGVGLALQTFDDGRGTGPALYVGGNFTAAGGVTAPNIARFDGQSWSGLGDGIGNTNAPPTFTQVRTLAAFGSGANRRLAAGGRFTHVGTQASSNIAIWSACGETGRTFCHGDGSATACPCGNASAPSARAGCLNSLLRGGTLRGEGEASLSDDTLILAGADMTNSTALYFQGVNVSNGGLGSVFGDGIKCVAGPFIRLGTKANALGGSSYPTGSDLPVSVRGQVPAAVTRRYSVRYRNAAAFCTVDTFNYTNALEIVWRP